MNRMQALPGKPSRHGAKKRKCSEIKYFRNFIAICAINGWKQIISKRKNKGEPMFDGKRIRKVLKRAFQNCLEE